MGESEKCPFGGEDSVVDRDNIPVCAKCGTNENVSAFYSYEFYFCREPDGMPWECVGCGCHWVQIELFDV